jgi:hypothetical protein
VGSVLRVCGAEGQGGEREMVEVRAPHGGRGRKRKREGATGAENRGESTRSAESRSYAAEKKLEA